MFSVQPKDPPNLSDSTLEKLKRPHGRTMSTILVRSLLDLVVTTTMTHAVSSILPDKKDLPQNEEFVDENGIRTTIEYTENEDGKRVKVRHQAQARLDTHLLLESQILPYQR